MNRPKLPQTDSIEELARFWDTHDLTDFEEELVEVTEPVFQATTAVKIHLQPQEVEAVKAIANTKGLRAEELIKEWILEKLPHA